MCRTLILIDPITISGVVIIQKNVGNSIIGDGVASILADVEMVSFFELAVVYKQGNQGNQGNVL